MVGMVSMVTMVTMVSLNRPFFVFAHFGHSRQFPDM